MSNEAPPARDITVRIEVNLTVSTTYTVGASCTEDALALVYEQLREPGSAATCSVVDEASSALRHDELDFTLSIEDETD